MDGSNNNVATYRYDPYGKVITATGTLADINPLRYRGYYYDTETGFYYLQSRYYDPAICRFVNADNYVVTSQGLNSYNMYAYCGNDPISRADDDGKCWDYIFDIGFLLWSISDVINDPSDWKNWVALGVDIVFAVVPFIPSGAGQVVKTGNKVDNAVDVANAINKIDNLSDASKVTMIGRSMERVTDTAHCIDKADNLYEGWKGYDAASTGLKKLMHSGIFMVDNGKWLFGKLRHGYTVIDIGISTSHKGYGLWYGTERAVSILWESRNLWKFVVNYQLKE